MSRRIGLWTAVLLFLAAPASLALAGPKAEPDPKAAASGVVCSPNAPFAVALAAKEVRRYGYLRSGRLLPMLAQLKDEAGLIVVGSKACPAVKSILEGPATHHAIQDLKPEQYLLKRITRSGRPTLLVVGGDPIGTLYGAYRLAELWGVRFYLEGDVIPDARIGLELPQVNEQGKPLFDRRGIQPFHDFPEGPDWWNVDGYKAVLAQLPKLRMNFFGLHTYPEGGVGPEPLVWIGQAGDVGTGSQVKFGYPSRHFTTLNGTWGYRPTKTGDYSFGTAALFDRDDYGVDYMKGMSPWPKTPQDSSELFQRMGDVLREAFTFARLVGVKTCVGTETPLVLPTPVRARLKAAGKDSAKPEVAQEVYEAMFRRIAQTHPLDYYWFWTPEGWTWEKVGQGQIDGTLADLRAAIAAAKKVKAPFTLATCGWVLGPPQQPALFDEFLPKDMPMSCINRQVGHAPVEPGFAKVKGRPTWAIPWMEDDPALTSVQLWAGRMRKDAADSLAYGCTGLLGIHWRTRILGPNVSALAAACWDQKAWNPAFNPDLKAALATAKEPEGPVGGQVAAFLQNRIAETQDEPLYQTVRYNVGAYNLNVPNGAYTVTLKFCEPHYSEKGKRVFGVKLQQKPVIESLDIFAKVGKNRALDYTFKDVQVSDGQLNIEFIYEVEFPAIAAIVVEGPATRKINCGGPAYKDYRADWPASTQGGQKRFLPAADFYADWALAQFGAEAAKPIAELFTQLDGRLPRPADWVNGPGGIKPDPRPWEQVQKEYAFVDQLCLLGSRVRGAGNRERFRYWLDSFRYLRAMAKVNCTWAQFNAAMAAVKAEKDPAAGKRLAHEKALPLRRELIAQVGEVHFHLLATLTTYGELGTVTNWQQHLLPDLLEKPGQELAKLLGEPLPADAQPPKELKSPPQRLVVPALRTCLTAGEPLALTVIVTGPKPEEAAVYWRPLASGDFSKVPLAPLGRNVYSATLPPEATKADLEYYVQARAASGTAGSAAGELRFPATAPTINQTVVVVSAEQSL